MSVGPGARGGSRTRKPLRVLAFKANAFTSFATLAPCFLTHLPHFCPHYSGTGIKGVISLGCCPLGLLCAESPLLSSYDPGPLLPPERRQRVFTGRAYHPLR